MSGATLWARSEIRRGRWSLVMVALLVAIAGGAVSAGVAGARRAGSSVDRYVAKSSPSSVVIFSQEPLDAELTSELDADPRVTGRYTTRIVAATQVGVPPGSGGVTLAVPDEFWGGVAEPRIVEGRYPSGPDEIAMTESMSDRGVEVGDTVQMHLMSVADTFTCLESGGTWVHGGFVGQGTCGYSSVEAAASAVEASWTWDGGGSVGRTVARFAWAMRPVTSTKEL